MRQPWHATRSGPLPILIALAALFVNSLSSADANAEREQAVARALQQLEQCPAWSELKEGDMASRREITECIKHLSTYPLEVLREAVQREVSAREAAGTYDVAAMSRLYLLNRFLFKVPSDAPVGLKRYGSFAGIPHDSKTVNELWPWSLDKNGQLELTGTFRGYFGESYLALEEFDDFRQKYGPRKP